VEKLSKNGNFSLIVNKGQNTRIIKRWWNYKQWLHIHHNPNPSLYICNIGLVKRLRMNWGCANNGSLRDGFLQEIIDLAIMTHVGITMKELEELKLGPLLIIQNNSSFLLHKGVKIQARGTSTSGWRCWD